MFHEEKLCFVALRVGGLWARGSFKWGTAVIDNAPISDDAIAPYLAKYAEGIKMINMTPESMLQSYSTVVRVTPNHVRSW